MSPSVRRNLITLGLFSALSIAFSWPLARDPLGMHVSPHFDMYTLAWLVNAAPTVDLGLQTPISGWPVGESLLRADSFVLLVLARVLVPVFGPTLPIAICSLLGPVASAWAAERMAARALGATWPLSLIAGAAYGFSGLMATALLEGHVYAMFLPWLPLLAWKGLDATRQGGTPRDAAWAGLWWGLCLLTTAYAGITASLLVVVLVVGALVRMQLEPRVAGAFVGVGGGIGLLYTLVFAAGGTAERLDRREIRSAIRTVMDSGATHFDTIAAWTPTLDLYRHSIAPSLGFTILVLLLFSPWLLRGTAGWRTLGFAGLVALALSFGPYLLVLNQGRTVVPWILFPLGDFAPATFFRFPGRFTTLAGLGLGGVAAVAATRIARHRPRVALALVACAFLDPLIQTRVSARAAEVPFSAPSAYLSAPEDGAVLDLVPTFLGQVGDLDLLVNNLTCAYQMNHRRPILSQCLGTGAEAGPRPRVTGWLVQEITNGGTGIVGKLASLGIRSVAFHPDLFGGSDRQRLGAGLVGLFGPPVMSSIDGGERIELYLVPTVETTPDGRKEAFTALTY